MTIQKYSVGMAMPFFNCYTVCDMFRRKKVDKKRLEHKLYLARESPEPVFDLSHCDLVEVPTGIYSLCKVFLKRSLLLQHNSLSSLSGGGELNSLGHLIILDISNNDISTLPSEISALKSLEELYANSNKLNGLPDSICSLENLKSLSLSENKLRNLPEEMGKLAKLQKLYLTGNPNLRHLPKTICKARRLVLIELTTGNFLYPPCAVAEAGTEAIKKFISDDVGAEYIPPNQMGDESSEMINKPNLEGENDTLYNLVLKGRILDLETEKLKRMEKLKSIQENNDLLLKQEFEMATVHKANKQQLLASISRQQSKLDFKLSQIQQERETDKFRLIEQLQEVENNADIAIKNLLSISKEPAAQLLEQEREEEEKLLAALNREHDTISKSHVLAAMQDILKQETDMFSKLDKNRIEMSRSILEQELDSGSKLADIFRNQDLQKSNWVAKLMEDNDLQKAAVSTLLERGDARSWGLLQQVRLVESQLGALTNIELDRKKLRMDEHINDLAEKRLNLSRLLTDLLAQQKERRAQLLSTLQIMEEHSAEDSEDFWLRQYQRLLEKLPEGLSQAQRNIDPKLAEMLLANGVLHCLPFLAKLTQCQSNTKSITEQHLLEAGVKIPADRLKILDALQLYSKEHISCEHAPSAPVLQDEASAPPNPPADIKAIVTLECVVCLDCRCDVIFVPCGHLCCCSECSASVGQCPLCRAGIERKITMLQANL
ncbi:E3 ubiquitin-protein ligase LRSAM1 isoform X1 [Dendroctonus ponderosae]|uniref:E3 ubiquitin-protein ligase LRSAM1 isoform X1 n=1 Tax=Dendroctonus ponderosae TaxID=77166 RepID=UPI002034F79E|nr:E3 ubiquitin-protein ligase LRSAM1 isoform X1 [Dendroctonus ponderosae]